MNETVYGIISDTHENPGIVEPAIGVLKHLGVQRLIVNGDVGTGEQHIALTMHCIGQSGLESYIQPGSHERLIDYEPVIDTFSERFSNVVDVLEHPKFEINGHHLVFLPGSDWVAGGEYLIKIGDFSSGTYRIDKGPVRITNINDLRKLVTEPGKTIVVCHVPRKFDSLENGVDMAYFAERNGRSLVPGIFLEKQIRKVLGENATDDAVKKVALQNGFSLKKENRGNDDLRKLYGELGIKKSLTGHFHESVHRATDSRGEKIEQDKFVDELFWNASYLDGLKAGILIVGGDALKYHNVDLREYGLR